MCMFGMTSIALELAVIDHILFPFSVTPLSLPPPHMHTHAPSTSRCLGHLPDSAADLIAPAGVRAATGTSHMLSYQNSNIINVLINV